MWNPKKLLLSMMRPWVLINMSCTIIFIIQLGHLVESYIQPTVTNSWVEERPLEEMEELPLTVRVCVKPGFNKTALCTLMQAIS